jgi:rhamnose utilization protein RhaD (predicted bifunctional aldolase and dehydrogenase)/NAD(P)-dependent dehydrogenase (short-subunit alcohol dehydrogenase family)
METETKLYYLDDLWDDGVARQLDEPELLRYRSNLLGSDLRITNFGGGNTSSKIAQADPLNESERTVLWVKGSGGDLGSIKRSGFATLYLDRLHDLEARYRGAAYEDEMVDLYPLCVFGRNAVAPSIDTPLHGFLPFAHVDHLHPDWGIALAAAANGRERMEEFNRRFGHHLVWLPWQRPGFELAMMLRRAVEHSPECDGMVLGGHGLFTWGETQRQCYVNTITVIDHLGQFVAEFLDQVGAKLFGGAAVETLPGARDLAANIFPYLRGRVSGALRPGEAASRPQSAPARQPSLRMIGSFSDAPEVRRFANSRDAGKLAYLGTSCPDHFVRTKIRPLLVPWDLTLAQGESSSLSGASRPSGLNRLDGLKRAIDDSLSDYRESYADYYRAHAEADSPAMRDPNPTVVLIPGVGMFSFGKSKKEARITGEFYINAIHVMEGATALGGIPPNGNSKPSKAVPQAGAAAPPEAFQVHANYVALPLREAFRIEYWKLEEAKLRRQPPEKELSRKVLVIVGGAHGIGRETVLLAIERGAHVVVADREAEGCAAIVAEIAANAGADAVVSAHVDIRDRNSIRAALRHAVTHFGGIDVLVNTAAVFASSPDGRISDEQWRQTLDVNVTGNYLLADEVRGILLDQALPASMVLTSSANAVVAKAGSEAYDVSKAAVSHLVRELAISFAPYVRVNGVSPATVVKGSTMFPRDRVLASLAKYGIPHGPTEPTDELRDRLARFYAKRTLTQEPIEPRDCAEAILFLAGDRTGCTSGHLFPVDGGLTEAFLR